MSKVKLKQIEDIASGNVLSFDDLNNVVNYDNTSINDVLDNAKVLANYGALRAYNGRAKTIRISQTGIAGLFQLDSTDTTSTDNGGTVIVSMSGKHWKRVFNGNIKLSWFAPAKNKTVDDLAVFNKAASYAISVQNGTNKVVFIEVDAGDYKLSGPTVKGNWWLAPGAEFYDLAGVAPTYNTDTQYLTGKMFRFSGVDQYTSLFVGDTAYKVQKYTTRAFTAAIVGASNRASGGVSGLSYASARAEYDQATIGVIGVGLNDSPSVPKTSWGFYGEAIRTDAACGNAFGQELTTWNYGSEVQLNPYQQPGETTGASVASWLSSAGTYDSTAAVGIIPNEKKFHRGIVFFNGAVTSNEAVVMPFGYRNVWYTSGINTPVAYSGANINQLYSINDTTYIRGTRGGNTTVANSLINYQEWSGNNAGVAVALATSRVYQTSALSNGFATSRWDWSAKTSTGSDNFFSLDSTSVFPLTNASLSIGKVTNRFSEAYVNNIFSGNINVDSIELGGNDVQNTTRVIDTHTSGNNIDYDVRLEFNGGSTTSGNGNLIVRAALFDYNGVFRSLADLGMSIGQAARRISNVFAQNLRPGAGTVIWTSGTGSPEGVLAAVAGSLYTRTDGGANTTLYVKESGTGNTGWVAK